MWKLLILTGTATMLARNTVVVYCEVNFTDLYQDAPLFGDLDQFMRRNGFFLAGLWPMQFGYMRIPRDLRGPGVPLQGEALYLLKPENARTQDPIARQTRLEKLAFCALAFGFIDVAYKSLQISEQPDDLVGGRIHEFLKLFRREIERNPALPPLWHEVVEIKEKAQMPRNINRQSHSQLSGLIDRLVANPLNFWTDTKIYLANQFIRKLILFNLHRLGFNRFEIFLTDHGFVKAANEVFKRRIR